MDKWIRQHVDGPLYMWGYLLVAAAIFPFFPDQTSDCVALPFIAASSSTFSRMRFFAPSQAAASMLVVKPSSPVATPF